MVFCASLVLSWFFHKDSVKFTDRNELWSDRAGYYIYLPATFFYHFDTHSMPADLDMQTGGGFNIDTLRNKIDTKYTYGVALLASPFFIAAGIISRIAGYHSESGFSLIYMRMMSLAAVVYLLLGLFFLRKFLDHYFQPVISTIVIFLVFLGTNLFYYSLLDGMMSHVYSFFLFALFLYSLKRFQSTQSYLWFLLLCIVLSVAVLIRPTNILLGLFLFFWDATGPDEWLKRMKQFLKPSYVLPFLAILFIIFLPQIIYWKYLSGNWIHFSYGNEGFGNWRHPRIMEVLFSPVNGLIAYTPLALFMVIGTGLMIVRKQSNGWFIAGIFMMVTFICASWEMWYFGCSYGQRSFIEYYTVLAVPLGWLVTMVLRNRFFLVKSIVLFMVLFTAYASLRYTVVLYRFDRCYYGSTWDWDHYMRSVERAGIISPVHRISSCENDFENLALCPVIKPSRLFTRSGQISIPCDEKRGITPLYSARLYEFKYPWPKSMDVEVWMLSPGKMGNNVALSCNFSRGDIPVFGDRLKISSLMAAPLVWTKIQKRFIFPDVNDSSLQVSIFIENPGRTMLFTDDLSIRYHYGWNR